jgi:hypothetical protein
LALKKGQPSQIANSLVGDEEDIFACHPSSLHSVFHDMPKELDGQHQIYLRAYQSDQQERSEWIPPHVNQ